MVLCLALDMGFLLLSEGLHSEGCLSLPHNSRLGYLGVQEAGISVFLECRNRL